MIIAIVCTGRLRQVQRKGWAPRQGTLDLGLLVEGGALIGTHGVAVLAIAQAQLREVPCVICCNEQLITYYTGRFAKLRVIQVLRRVPSGRCMGAPRKVDENRFLRKSGLGGESRLLWAPPVCQVQGLAGGAH